MEVEREKERERTGLKSFAELMKSRWIRHCSVPSLHVAMTVVYIVTYLKICNHYR